MADNGWELYYHPLAGRGEFVRLLFEESGVPFTEINDNIRPKIMEGGIGGYPAYAPPVIRKGKLPLLLIISVYAYSYFVRHRTYKSAIE